MTWVIRKHKSRVRRKHQIRTQGNHKRRHTRHRMAVTLQPKRHRAR